MSQAAATAHPLMLRVVLLFAAALGERAMDLISLTGPWAVDLASRLLQRSEMNVPTASRSYDIYQPGARGCQISQVRLCLTAMRFILRLFLPGCLPWCRGE